MSPQAPRPLNLNVNSAPSSRRAQASSPSPTRTSIVCSSVFFASTLSFRFISSLPFSCPPAPFLLCSPSLTHNTVTYADGEFLTGTFGHDSVTLANITVSNQQVAAVTFAGWEGDGVTSGLVGLAFPNITSAFSGTDPAADSPATQVLYNPLFTNMYTEGSVPALFSVALDRNNGTGVLAIGGTPPGLDLTQPNASAPFRYLKVDGHAATSYQFYTIDVSAVVSLPPGDESSSSSPSSSVFESGAFDPVRRARKPRVFQAIVDSGTTLLYLPDALAAEFNALWDPPAQYDAEEGVYAVACDAVPAGLHIVVNGTGFALDAADLVLDGGEADGSCISGVAGAGQGFSIIGDVFLKSVLAVFD
ncbi:MAG: hypothetical protein LQ340_007909, partial [Diploschistes diacapsis]